LHTYRQCTHEGHSKGHWSYISQDLRDFPEILDLLEIPDVREGNVPNLMPKQAESVGQFGVWICNVGSEYTPIAMGRATVARLARDLWKEALQTSTTLPLSGVHRSLLASFSFCLKVGKKVKSHINLWPSTPVGKGPPGVGVPWGESPTGGHSHRGRPLGLVLGPASTCPPYSCGTTTGGSE